MVVKKDGTREPFDRNKVLGGLRKAWEKRPVSPASLEQVADEVEQMLQEIPERQILTAKIGEEVTGRLGELDKVAYVRLASVYRESEGPGQFLEVLNDL